MLFQLLCAVRQWERAVQQLQVYAQLDPRQAPAAQACRDLIRAERRRALVFGGSERPGFVYEPPSWVDGLLDALRLTALGQLDEADRARERALDHAPLVPVRSSQLQLDWIADSDSRLGPVCELVSAGHYRWLPFSDIAAWKIEEPTMLLDLVWAPCSLKLADGSAMRGFMPARYPATAVTQAAGRQSDPTPECEDDAWLLGRKTSWQEVGRTGVFGHGQKTWTTNAGDFGVFELGSCEFGHGGLVGTPERGGEVDVEA